MRDKLAFINIIMYNSINLGFGQEQEIQRDICLQHKRAYRLRKEGPPTQSSRRNFS